MDRIPPLLPFGDREGEGLVEDGGEAVDERHLGHDGVEQVGPEVGHRAHEQPAGAAAAGGQAVGAGPALGDQVVGAGDEVGERVHLVQELPVVVPVTAQLAPAANVSDREHDAAVEEADAATPRTSGRSRPRRSRSRRATSGRGRRSGARAGTRSRSGSACRRARSPRPGGSRTARGRSPGTGWRFTRRRGARRRVVVVGRGRHHQRRVLVADGHPRRTRGCRPATRSTPRRASRSRGRRPPRRRRRGSAPGVVRRRRRAPTPPGSRRTRRRRRGGCRPAPGGRSSTKRGPVSRPA